MARDAAESASVAVARINLAIGLVDTSSGAEAIAGALRGRRIDLGRCRFVVPSIAPAFDDEAVARLATMIAVERIVPNGGAFNVALIGSMLARLMPTVPECSTTAHSWDMSEPALARHNERLARHLEAGGGTLIAAFDTPHEHEVVAGLLLRFARGGVITHQFRTGHASDAPAVPKPAPEAAAHTT